MSIIQDSTESAGLIQSEQYEARARVATLIESAPTYMIMEDAARYLDTLSVDPWFINTFSAMRRSLNEISYWHKRTRP